MKKLLHKMAPLIAAAAAFIMKAVIAYMYNRLMRMDLDEFGRFVKQGERPVF